MKKLLPLYLLFLLSGCTEKESATTEQNNFTNDKDKNGIISEDELVYPDVVIKEKEIEFHESAYLLDTVSGDLTGDGKGEEVSLYISPSPFDEETGEAIWWEHLHLWQLVVKDGEKTYPLFNNDSSGKLSFWMTETPEQNLILVEESGNQLIVYEFTYNDGNFEREILVDSGLTFNRSQVEW